MLWHCARHSGFEYRCGLILFSRSKLLLYCHQVRQHCAVQVDFLMSGLMVLKERIDATEALIAIDLDNRRNELVAFDLVRSSPCLHGL